MVSLHLTVEVVLESKGPERHWLSYEPEFICHEEAAAKVHAVAEANNIIRVPHIMI